MYTPSFKDLVEHLGWYSREVDEQPPVFTSQFGHELVVKAKVSQPFGTQQRPIPPSPLPPSYSGVFPQEGQAEPESGPPAFTRQSMMS